jgi:hypothetical protein
MRVEHFCLSYKGQRRPKLNRLAWPSDTTEADGPEGVGRLFETEQLFSSLLQLSKLLLQAAPPSLLLRTAAFRRFFQPLLRCQQDTDSFYNLVLLLLF